MAFNSKTYHRRRSLRRAKDAIEDGKKLRDGTHELCKVLAPERIAQNIRLCIGQARFYRNLAKLD